MLPISNRIRLGGRATAPLLLARGLAKRSRGGGGGRKSGAEAQPVASLDRVRKVRPGGRVLMEGVSLRLLAGAKVGVLGPNGAGKSSLLRLIAGLDDEHEGETWRAPALRIGMLEQEPTLDETRSVLDNILDGVPQQREALERFEAVNAAIEVVAGGGAVEVAGGGGGGEEAEAADLDDLLSEQAALTERIEALDCWNLHAQVRAATQALNCPPDGALPSELSGGQRRRVALCRLLVSAPELLLLDEPTNHLDTASVAWLERWLAAHRGTVVAVTHDRYFLDNVAGWILDIDGGATHS
jgi:ATPase subunit of ABC transporter with duplicated ATPase domains